MLVILFLMALATLPTWPHSRRKIQRVQGNAGRLSPAPASTNLLVAKSIGSLVNIGPVAATVGMLFWSWVLGGVGLLLAVPLTASAKLVADCHPALIPISNLLAESPRPVPRWAQERERFRSCAIVFALRHMQKRNCYTCPFGQFDFPSS